VTGPERVANPLRSAAGRVTLPLRELTGWEEEFLERRQYDANTARTCDEVLARCCVTPGTEPDDDVRGRVRALLVAERDRELVRLRRMSLGPDVEAQVTCPACGEPNDARFSLDDLELDAEMPERRSGIEVADDELTITLPTAGDQEELLDAGLDTSAERRTWLLGRCLRDRDGRPIGLDAARALPVLRRTTLERAVDDLLPTLDLEMGVACAHCATAFAAPFDVHAFFFRVDRAGRRSAPGRAPARHRLPLVGAAGVGPAPPAPPGIPAADRGGRRPGPDRGPRRRRRAPAADLTRATTSP
jgi:hypothetical protein